MKKHEKITIALLVALLVVSIALLFKPRPSGAPTIDEQAPSLTNPSPEQTGDGNE